MAWLEYHTLETLPKSTDEDEQAHNNTQRLTHQLHVVRAHLLHYEGLLDDFRKTVEFVLRTPHPGLRTTTSPLNPSSSDFNLISPASPSSRRRYSLSPSRPVYFSRSRIPPIQQIRSGGSISSQPLSPEHDDSDEESAMQDQMKDYELKDQLDHSDSHLQKESIQLLNEIKRLEMTRRTLDKRLGNVMALVSAHVLLCAISLTFTFTGIQQREYRRQ